MGEQRAPVSEGLGRLGYVARQVAGVWVIVPPTCEVPAGPFLMGADPTEDPLANFDELPMHEVYVDAFSMAKYPVTVAEYRCAIEAGALPPLAQTFMSMSGSYPDVVETYLTWEEQLNRPEHPVVGVSWIDAVSYANWLARMTGTSWRLPTEAEWEKAARGQDRLIFPWGNEWDASRAQSWASGVWDTGPVGAHPDGASPYGVEDMSGNVDEWVSSLFMPYPYSPLDGREDLTKTEDDGVTRGGGWLDDARGMRTTMRNDFPVSLLTVGFRLAHSL